MGIVVILAGFLGGLRILGVTHIAFKAAAHLFVGGLFGGWLVNATSKERIQEGYPIKWELLWLFLAMTLLEIVCFVLTPSELKTQLLSHFQ